MTKDHLFTHQFTWYSQTVSGTMLDTGNIELKAQSQNTKAVRQIQSLCSGASLVAQWLRIRLPMQRTWVRALVREDPTARAPQLLSLCSGAREPQLLGLHATAAEACAPGADRKSVV